MNAIRVLGILVASLALIGVAEAQKGGGKPGGGGGGSKPKTQVYFDEQFDANLDPLRLEDPQLGFVIENGAARRNAYEGIYTEDRRYIRTIKSDYNDRDFKYELVIGQPESGPQDILYVGIGTGDQDFSYFTEVLYGLHFRIHRGWINGRVDVASHLIGYEGFGYFRTVGYIPESYSGDLIVAIEKNGLTAQFSISWQCELPSPCTLTDTVDLATAAPFLTSTTSYLYFGNGSGSYFYDRVRISKLRGR